MSDETQLPGLRTRSQTYMVLIGAVVLILVVGLAVPFAFGTVPSDQTATQQDSGGGNINLNTKKGLGRSGGECKSGNALAPSATGVSQDDNHSPQLWLQVAGER